MFAPMTRDDLLPVLLEIAREVIGAEDLEFNAETPFEQIDEWDSMSHLHIVVTMEKVFGIRFDDAARLQGVVRIQDLLDIIADLKGL